MRSIPQLSLSKLFLITNTPSPGVEPGEIIRGSQVPVKRTSQHIQRFFFFAKTMEVLGCWEQTTLGVFPNFCHVGLLAKIIVLFLLLKIKLTLEISGGMSPLAPCGYVPSPQPLLSLPHLYFNKVALTPSFGQ